MEHDVCLRTAPPTRHVLQRLAPAFAAALAASVAALIAGTPVPASAADGAFLDAAARRAVVEELANDLTNVYVFAEKGAAYAEGLRERLARGDYDDLAEPAAFANRLTDDLHSLHLDKHLRVLAPNDPGAARFRPPPAPTGGEPAADPMKAYAERARAQNFGFAKVEILPGNVGLIDLREFAPAEVAGPTAVAAMAFVGGCDAILFDLRKNGGGSPSMIQLLASYLFEGPPQVLNTFYIREGDVTQQFATLPHIPGTRRPDVDVFVLTSASTFSAAEEFTYNLKHMERATIVGETTGGGAHPVRPADLGHGFLATIPFGRAINPITGTNWEGTGVAPHLPCSAGDALATAHAEAITRLAAKATDPRARRALEWTLDEVKAGSRANAAGEPSAWKGFAGRYGPRSVTFDGKSLAIQRENGPRIALKPVAENLFALEGAPAPMRVRFERKAKGDAMTLVLLTPEGEIERADRI